MKRLFQILVFSIAFTSCIIQLDDNPGPSDVFVKYLGEIGEHGVSDILVNSEGDIVVFGTQESTVTSTFQTFYLVKTDSVGNQLGESLVIDPGMPEMLDTTVISESSRIKEIDNGYLIVGNCVFTDGNSQGNFFIFWAHLQDNQNQLTLVDWDTISAPPVQQERRDMRGSDIIQDINGDIIIAGTTFQSQPNDQSPSGNAQNLLVKKEFTSEAATIWRRSDGRTNFIDGLISITEQENGDLLCVGSTNRVGTNGETGLNVTFHQYNNDALSPVNVALRVGMDLGPGTDDIPRDVIEFSGGVKVVGTSTFGNAARAFVMTFQGSQVKKELIEYGTDNISGHSLTSTRGGDLVIVGSNLSIQNGDVFAIRTSSIGWERTNIDPLIFGNGTGSDVAKTAVTLPTGSILIGADMDFGSGQVMIGLIKMNDRVELQRQ